MCKNKSARIIKLFKYAKIFAIFSKKKCIQRILKMGNYTLKRHLCENQCKIVLLIRILTHAAELKALLEGNCLLEMSNKIQQPQTNTC